MKSLLFLRTTQAPAPDEQPTGNLRLAGLVGAEVRFITPQEYAQRAELMAEAAGEGDYIIPEGGSNALGSWGYIRAVDELAARWDTPPSAVVCATISTLRVKQKQNRTATLSWQRCALKRIASTPRTLVIANRALDSEHTLYVGINGAQGTGKTTLGKLLVTLLSAREFRVANFSIDDFYLTQSERNQLAESQHPLLATRGVPGTHDISLLMTKFEELKNLKAEQVCELPRFNKAIDDRCGTEDWQKLIGPIDAVILEGWFVGAPPQATRDIESCR